MPRNTCSWIKGLLGVMEDLKDKITTIIAVTEGDCSNNHSLINLYKYYYPHINIIPFSFPTDKNPEKLKMELDKLKRIFSVSDTSIIESKQILDKIREKIKKFDQMQNDNHSLAGRLIQQTLVSSSDFNSNYQQYELDLDQSINILNKKKASPKRIKIGYTGVPTIISDLFDHIEDSFPIDVTFFEVEQDFAMYKKKINILDQYLSFNYPYDIFPRIKLINNEIKKRGLKAMIHYTQSFCHRQIDDILVHKLLDVPVLTIEGEAPGVLDMRTKNRIECFMENILESTGV